ncbi:MAG: type II toxin-antitoxin system RelE/ParE family toxin [Proteobacteria bacterium]|nr:type II toxin-antitoxin system RelE/ParE family toxin [Pseudomonadota bacterium]
MEVWLLEEFSTWLSSLRDARARVKITARLTRLSLGNAGDVAAVGEGVSEMRINFGPGYRIYYFQHGSVLAIVVGGGDKSTQDADIKRALSLARQWKQENAS